ncbi:hypothetical protein PVW53_19755 [Seohaeicola sp. SP36]|uniref:hypothetical protein n=1 Tax=unclassified Seohaeicola TaxID=2641111 RepID=UPI00237A0E1C|nr:MULTISPECIES: hypothetical protein [unclassified Seohaeicola]MDD9709503.1 hypothetical protein [Seohaeicola sp. 4SK31]MDD9737746.1 hypothetical protein [Seohaeicola sp. SP36]
MSKIEKISAKRAAAIIADMREEECLNIDVKADGPRAIVTVGQHGGIWHRFDDYPSVEELQSTVRDAWEVDLESQRENA